MALAGPGWTEQEHVLALRDEAGGGELVDERAIHLLIEIKVKRVERALRVAKARELVAPLEQTVLPPAEFVRDEGGDEIDRRHLFSLRLSQPRLQDCRHPGETELAERTIEFDEIHDGSPVVRSMRSR